MSDISQSLQIIQGNNDIIITNSDIYNDTFQYSTDDIDVSLSLHIEGDDMEQNKSKLIEQYKRQKQVDNNFVQLRKQIEQKPKRKRRDIFQKYKKNYEEPLEKREYLHIFDKVFNIQGNKKIQNMEHQKKETVKAIQPQYINTIVNNQQRTKHFNKKSLFQEVQINKIKLEKNNCLVQKKAINGQFKQQNFDFSKIQQRVSIIQSNQLNESRDSNELEYLLHAPIFQNSKNNQYKPSQTQGLVQRSQFIKVQQPMKIIQKHINRQQKPIKLQSMKIVQHSLKIQQNLNQNEQNINKGQQQNNKVKQNIRKSINIQQSVQIQQDIKQFQTIQQSQKYHQNRITSPLNISLAQSIPIKLYDCNIEDSNSYRGQFSSKFLMTESSARSVNQQDEILMNKIAPIKIYFTEQKRIPIFMRNLRKYNSIYPNFNHPNASNFLTTVIKQLHLLIESILKAVEFVDESCEQVHQNKSKINIYKYEFTNRSSMELFLNSGWQKNCIITKQQQLKPRDNYMSRPWAYQKIKNALANYKSIITYYKNCKIQIFRQFKIYQKVRTKFWQIQKNLKQIAEDVYTQSLQSNFPSHYIQYLNYMKQPFPKLKNRIIIQQRHKLLAKYIYLRNKKDHLICSKVGKEIYEKIQTQLKYLQPH